MERETARKVERQKNNRTINIIEKRLFMIDVSIHMYTYVKSRGIFRESYRESVRKRETKRKKE